MSAGHRTSACAVAILALCAASGCGGGLPSYDGARACGVGADRVAAVLGTDHFQVRARGAVSLPAGHMDCHADLKDQSYAFAVIVAPVDDAGRAEQERNVARSEVRFERGGGRIGIDLSGDALTGTWVCDRMRAYVTAEVGEDSTAQDARNLMTSMADAVGCRIPS